MSKPTIARLGKRLDDAERAASAMWAADKGTFSFSPDSVPFEEFERIMHRRHVAKLDYSQALTERNRIAKEKFRNRKTAPKSRDAFKYRDAKFETEDRLDTLDALGSDFYTEREYQDAYSAFALADWIWDEAQERYNSEEAQSRRRDAAYRFAVGSHSRPVTDGYVKTGNFKMIDGERVPVLEKIE